MYGSFYCYKTCFLQYKKYQVCCYIFSEDSSESMSSPVRQDSMSEYSNMSEPGKLEIDTGSATANTDTKSGGDNEVSNVCYLAILLFCLVFHLRYESTILLYQRL